MTRHTMNTLLLGAIVAGTLDILFATVFWAIRAAVAPMQILQSVASGLLGDASFAGGSATAVLGLGLHYLIMLAMVGAYYLSARKLVLLWRQPWPCGVLYGLLLYAVMSFIVVPLSAAAPGPRDPYWIAGSVVMHVLVGLLCAGFAVRALGRPKS